jgi:hypothetical protein
VDNKGENLLKRKHHSIEYHPKAQFDSFMDLGNDSGTKKLNSLSRNGVTFPLRFPAINLRNVGHYEQSQFNSIEIKFEETIT